MDTHTILNEIAVIGSLLLIFGCTSFYSTSEKFESLRDKMSVYVDSQYEEEIVFVAAEYDCSICIESLHKWIKDIESNSASPKTIGLFFSTENLSEKDNIIKKINLPSNINWEMTTKTDVFDFLSREFPDINSPYVIKYTNNEIQYVKSVNKDDYSFD